MFKVKTHKPYCTYQRQRERERERREGKRVSKLNAWYDVKRYFIEKVCAQ
jgi:hypothetical protein